MKSKRKISLAEAQFEEGVAHRFYPETRDGYSAMIPALLRSAVFALGATRGMVDRTFPVARFDSIDVCSDGSVHYKGPQLGQLHKRVILGLLKLAEGKIGDFTLSFHAKAFLGSIGRDACTANVEGLREVLADLRAGTFILRNYSADRGCVFGFVNRVEWDKRNFTVSMDRRAAQAFAERSRPTYLWTEMRNRLSDGLQTALFDLFASTKQADYQLADLAAIWGREVKEFGRDTRLALDKMMKVGALKECDVARGRVKIKRAIRL